MTPGFRPIGSIERKVDGTPAIVDTDWVTFIGSRPELVKGPPQYGRNPANGQVIELRRGNTCRGISSGKQVIGYLDFEFWEYTDKNDGSAVGNVVVGSAPGFEKPVAELASNFAAVLNAQYHPRDRNGG
ncbi:hypothetical protein CA13_00760 [Planctomycetes bacterium CA13]|uniref:Uncharacterized protein n=1 Tax=Novipirellula herctigrandis TaxID=2527986 RepID=A0A5C5YV24_9BACT|nr:hypothetical protein CA13_00760 [Planctomycetes bacterium CA13]